MLYHLVEKHLYDSYNESIIRYEDKASGEVLLKPGFNAFQLYILAGGGGVDNYHGGADRDIFVVGDGTVHVYDVDDDGVLSDLDGNLLSGDWLKRMSIIKKTSLGTGS